MKLTEAELQHAIAELPDNIKRAVVQFDWAQVILEIGKDYDMHIDDIETFRYETLLVILGRSDAGEYENILARSLNIPLSKARVLVGKANEQIFSELQHRAFSSDNKENDTIIPPTSPLQKPQNDNDPYHEPISHEDLRGTMRAEGIELLDHDEPFHPHVEKSGIASETENKIVNPIDIHKNNIDYENAAGMDDLDHSGLSTSNNDYREPIEVDDTTGPKQRSVDTNILKTLHQQEPTGILDTETPVPLRTPNLDQSLDMKLMNETHIPETNSLQAESDSLLESDTVSENFLSKISTTEKND